MKAVTTEKELSVFLTARTIGWPALGLHRMTIKKRSDAWIWEHGNDYYGIRLLGLKFMVGPFSSRYTHPPR